jgi:hypothetical protein
MTNATPITSLEDPGMHSRSAYGTRAGALRDAARNFDGDHALFEQAFRALVDACSSREEADGLLIAARNAVFRGGIDGLDALLDLGRR